MRHTRIIVAHYGGPEALRVVEEQMRDRIPELLALSLRQPALPAATYRAILSFLASNPSPAQITAFAPPPEGQARRRALLGGVTEAGNRALACWRCNQHKGTDLASFDPQTGALTLLFTPAPRHGATISCWRVRRCWA